MIPPVRLDSASEMILEMHPSLKKVADFMQQELPANELRGVANALAIIAPAIWGRYEEIYIHPITFSRPLVQLD